MSPRDLIYKEECYAVIGACFEVYKIKGSGFLEEVYQECLEIELGLRNIPFVAKPKLELEYKGNKLRKGFVPDLTSHGKIIIELKAVSNLGDEHRAQVLNYLNASGFQLGLLINFAHCPLLQWERIALNQNPSQKPPTLLS